MNISWIGAGKMTHSFLTGFSNLQNEVTHHLSTAHPEKLKEWHTEFKFIEHTHNRECVEHADMIILAVKPQQLKAVLEEIGPFIPKHALILSLAAAVDLALLETWLKRSLKVGRLMPNTAVAIRKGSIAFSVNANWDDNEIQDTINLFTNVGSVYRMDESLINPFIASSGSGIAFVYALLDAFTQASIHQGFSPKQASKITLETFQAAVLMAKESQTPLAQLISNVCSKGGTTIEGIAVLNNADLTGLFDETFEATLQKAKALNDAFKNTSSD